MLAYVMHLLNHAVGLISLETMENVLWYVFRIWTNRPAQLFSIAASSSITRWRFVRYAAADTCGDYMLRSGPDPARLRYPAPARPPRHRHAHLGQLLPLISGDIAYLLWVYFVRSPEHGVVQMLVLVVAWGHAMIGLHFWLSASLVCTPAMAALVGAVLVPVLSLLGAIEVGRQVSALAADPNWIHERITLPSPETQRTLEAITDLLSCFFGMVGAVLLARRPSHLATSPRPRAHRLS
jgi:adenylate cyclase